MDAVPDRKVHFSRQCRQRICCHGTPENALSPESKYSGTSTAFFVSRVSRIFCPGVRHTEISGYSLTVSFAHINSLPNATKSPVKYQAVFPPPRRGIHFYERQKTVFVPGSTCRKGLRSVIARTRHSRTPDKEKMMKMMMDDTAATIVV